MKIPKIFTLLILIVFTFVFPIPTSAWNDEPHLAIAKAAVYSKWYNACGADMAKLKAGDREKNNHYVNNPPGTTVTSELVFSQIEKYNQIDRDGHLYGAIIASIHDYLTYKQKGKYGEYHLAFCAHYVGDLSMPLHNTIYNSFNKKYHKTMDGILNGKVLDNLHKIRIYPITINSEKDLTGEIARIANISQKLGYKLEAEKRLLTEEEAYAQISHSASLLRAILDYIDIIFNSYKSD